MLVRAVLWAALPIALFACGELKSANPTNPEGSSGSSGSPSGATGSTSSSGSGASQHSSTGTTGPGPEGALPGGYCCTSDDDCRNRHCVDLGGGKMCLDHCFLSDSPCKRPGYDWTCDKSTDPGFCKPGGAFTCVPAATYPRGSRETGACCSATNDGTAGFECTSGLCESFSDGPFFCSRVCVRTEDCPNAYTCTDVDIGYKICAPGNATYTCN